MGIGQHVPGLLIRAGNSYIREHAIGPLKRGCDASHLREGMAREPRGWMTRGLGFLHALTESYVIPKQFF